MTTRPTDLIGRTIPGLVGNHELGGSETQQPTLLVQADALLGRGAIDRSAQPPADGGQYGRTRLRKDTADGARFIEQLAVDGPQPAADAVAIILDLAKNGYVPPRAGWLPRLAELDAMTVHAIADAAVRDSGSPGLEGVGGLDFLANRVVKAATAAEVQIPIDWSSLGAARPSYERDTDGRVFLNIKALTPNQGPRNPKLAAIIEKLTASGFDVRYSGGEHHE